MGTRGGALKLFDAHCHLQDPRIYHVAPQLIKTTLSSGVRRFAVNGVSEKDWHIVKEMADTYPSVIPCFGLHPWYVEDRSADWFKSMKGFFETTPSAAVGEIGLDKGSHGREIDFQSQIEVFEQQLKLAKEIEKPASVHCVRAFGDVLQAMQSIGPFPAGVILHSFQGSAEVVPGFAKLGAYFSFSGYIMSLKTQKAKKMLKAVPTDRILLESDAPDALPQGNLSSLLCVPGDASVPDELWKRGQDLDSIAIPPSNDSIAATDTSVLSKETLNHPANMHIVLSYVASMLEISEEELAEISYRNAVRIFSYPGSKINRES
ncbi:hypothetical protein H6P81_008248 [Aristolochia fimbriata]|uniref:TatD related DNase n=1 Tax=Aristolochia fimbriata TaxID=158543 RepID=A0AAV7F3Q4_ARIFI|nr:hypothetical protein H6P81_008248 [Aristolochia fimbriata]